MEKQKKLSVSPQNDNSPKYNPNEIEAKWSKVWAQNKTFSPDTRLAKKPYYNLMMFPYPSAEGLHVGNMYAQTGADVHARFKRMQGFDVFEPIGLDGFGIHSENYALKVGTHPMRQAEKSERNFYRQMHAIGTSVDWQRTVETYDPSYYKWTQWIFTQLFKAGLAYRKKEAVNWCPSCKTVLSDEQVIAGECERCGSVVEKRDLEQWFFRITEYAQKLLDNLDELDWTEKVKIAQRNWIGRSEGARVKFPISNFQFSEIKELEVFTTRPDTLYGATFMAVSPEHPIVTSLIMSKVKMQNAKLDEIEKYVKEAAAKTEAERVEEGKEKTGVFSGLYAINPVSNEEIPIWVADYVLMGYGTGAIMAVPAHDERDFEFAKKYGLPIKPVVLRTDLEYRSYLMGANDITDKDLTVLGIHIVKKPKEGVRLITIPKDKLEEYERLIVKKLTPGFWNEYIGTETVYLFKYNDGSVKRIVLTDETNDRIVALAAEFNNSKRGRETVWSWQAENEWYKDMLIHFGPGILINSGEWNGWQMPSEIDKVFEDIKKRGVGEKSVTFHLRDWLISRQRYWGPPIPMIFCESCAKKGISWQDTQEGKQDQESKVKDQNKFKSFNLKISNSEKWNSAGWFPVEMEHLPVELPYIQDFKPLGTGKAPLANHPEFYETKCPVCYGIAKRETDVSDTFLDSAWYFLRYPSSDIDNTAFDIDITKKWLPVNIYIGGAEHAVLHLLYARFVTMVLADLKLIDFEEPFTKFFAHGLIIKDGAKMSKSRGNVVIPDEYITKYGADTLRMYLMFLGAFSQGGDFRDSGIEGMNRFLKRVWRFYHTVGYLPQEDEEVVRMLHKTIKAVTEDIASLSYNTAIARLMEFYNFIAHRKVLAKSTLEKYLKLFAPFAPFMAEEIYQKMILEEVNFKASIHFSSWPEYENKYLLLQNVVVVIQENGMRRGELEVPVGKKSDKAYIEEKAYEVMADRLDKSKIKKIIHVPGKIINFVV